MKKQLEIAIVNANSAPIQGYEICWLLSRTQVEFALKEVEIFSSPPFATAAKYQEAMLPVINLEKYYGLEQKEGNGLTKYFVIRSVNEKKELVKLIIKTPQALKMQKVETDFKPFPSLVLPQNSVNVLGVYALGTGKLGVVPDFIGMTRSIRWQENQDQ